jgi:hypothetical protein
MSAAASNADFVQPTSFAFSEANLAEAKKHIAKYPKGRQASAVMPLLWLAQYQEGWVSRVAMDVIAEMLEMAPIRVYEVATFYTMYNLKPSGSIWCRSAARRPAGCAARMVWPISARRSSASICMAPAPTASSPSWKSNASAPA